jgi:hypothetical protein
MGKESLNRKQGDVKHGRSKQLGEHGMLALLSVNCVPYCSISGLCVFFAALDRVL